MAVIEVCSETQFSKKSCHIETIQLICKIDSTDFLQRYASFEETR